MNTTTTNAWEAGGPPTYLPRLTFCTACFAPADRLDILNSFSQGLYTYNGSQIDGSAPQLELTAWALEDIAAASVSYGPTVTQVADDFDENFQEKVFLRWVVSGNIRVAVADETYEFGPNSLFLMQARHRLNAVDDGCSFSLRLPFDRVGYDPLRHGPVVELRQDHWHVRVLVSAIKALFEILPMMPPEEVPEISAQLAELVRAVLTNCTLDDQVNATLQAHRAHAMRRYLMENLARTDMGVGHLQAQFNASRATVYRAFEDVGGVASFLRQNRLAAVHRDLRHARPERGMIRRIAEQHGLWDQTSFLRMFRSEFGVRPSEVLGTLHCETASDHTARGAQVSACHNLAGFWAANASPSR